MRLSLLICTIPTRAHFLHRLQQRLLPQCGSDVEVLVDGDGTHVSIGTKRNNMLARAHGDYIAFIDDDDLVSQNYVKLVLNALTGNPDCAELRGIITEDGKNPKRFHHTIECQEWCEKDGVYLRYPNHLNAIRRDLALKAGFTEKWYGEDKDFSDRVKPMLKTMGQIPEVIYHYLYRSKK